MKIVNPATEAVIHTVEEDDVASLERKAAAARAAQPGWACVPLSARLDIVRRFGDLLAEERDDLAALLTSEMGKPITQSRNEIDAMQGRIAFFLEQTPATLAHEIAGRLPALDERISYEPLGVVANISAWNYPYFVGSNVFLPALLTGNTVLYKPSEHAILTGLAIGQLLQEAGLPIGVFVPVIGAGRTGAALLEQDIDAVFFTGSYATGLRIAEAAAPRLLKVQLELGGKDPAYAAADVDVARTAAALADGAFYNAGQSCCAVERIYVAAPIAEAFVSAFIDEVRKFRIGDPTDESTYLGPLARKEQIEVLEEQVHDAVLKGGRVVHGGHRRMGTGWYFEPTVIAGATHEMKVMREESFGPIIGIQVVRDDAEALERMNDTEYGLTAAVYTQDRSRAERMLAEVNAGTVYWNCCDRVSPRLPWSGRKHSGLGSTLSISGIKAFVREKAWHMKHC